LALLFGKRKIQQTGDIMPVNCESENLPVLYLYNIDPDWDTHDIKAALKSNEKMAAALQEAGHPVISAELSNKDLTSLLLRHFSRDLIIFNQCESIPGIPYSEHEAVRIIESLGFVYTGSTPDVLMLTANKAETKKILESYNIPTPDWRVYNEPVAGDWNIFPAIVKTALEHCSISLGRESVVLNSRELESRIEYILKNYDQPALVEDFIDGREFHVPIWGNGEIKMLPVVEMDFSVFHDVHDRLCTYDSKFIPKSRHYKIIESLHPAPLSPDDLKILERVSIEAYRAIGCRDYARLDVRKRDGIFYVLDVNPNADLDSDASIACSAGYSGISYIEMMNYLVRLAANRHPLYCRSSNDSEINI
jgi:D-alanine-D-alanine ligase